jgi:hypothetical protein
MVHYLVFCFEINVKFSKKPQKRNKAANCSASLLEQRCCLDPQQLHAVKVSAIPDLRGTFLSSPEVLSGSGNHPVSYPTGKMVKIAAELT